MQSDPFLDTLKITFKDLYTTIKKKNYIILCPPKKYVTESMLTETFYVNHICYISKYNESMYVNLNGRVLQYQHPKLKSYLGWKKTMEFTIKEESRDSEGVTMYMIDNVCDDTNYNITTFSNKDVKTNTGGIKRCNTAKEYIEYYRTVESINEDYKSAVEDLDLCIKILRNNYVFMRGQEQFYIMSLCEEVRPIQDKIKTALSKSKPDENLLNTVVTELSDSLIYTKLYDFIMGNLIEFYKNEETEIKKKMKELPNKFELSTLGVDSCYKDLKFEKAIEKISDITKYKNIFEKVVSFLCFYI